MINFFIDLFYGYIDYDYQYVSYVQMSHLVVKYLDKWVDKNHI